MRNTIAILASILLWMPLEAQVAEETQEFRNEVGVNAIGLFANYLSFNDFIESNNPYLLTYKRSLGPGALRAGVFFNSYRNDEHQQLDGNRERDIQQELNLRLGYQWEIAVHRSVNLYYGIDLSVQAQRFNTRFRYQTWFNGPVEVTRISGYDQKDYGLAPVAAIQWMITPTVSLFTETNIRAFYSEYIGETRYEDVPEALAGLDQFAERINTSYDKGVDMMIPLDVFLAFRF